MILIDFELIHGTNLNYVVIISLVSALYGICLITYRLLFSPLAKFPGPKLAAVSRWYEMYFDVICGGIFLWEIDRMHEKYGPIVRISPYELHIKDPSYYNTLYAGPTKRRNKYKWFLSTGVPRSVFATVDYDHHRLRRGMLSPYLSKQAIRTLEPVIQQKVKSLCRHMQEALKTDEPLELHRCFISLAVDIVSHHAFGKSNCYDLLQEKKLDDRWKDGVTGVFAKFLLTRHFPWLIHAFRVLPLWASTIVVRSCPDIYFIEKEIKSRMKQVYVMNKHELKEPCIFAEVMHDEKLPASERNLGRLTDDALFLIVAGTDAPSQALAITMFHILNNSEVYEKLREELMRALPNPRVDPPLAMLETLPYLTAVIKEGLRISALVTSRLPRISPDGILEYVNWKIPAGTPVSMSIYLTLKDPSAFPEPLVFSPERWMEQGSTGLNLEKYLVPFSKGSQGCLGPNMAYAWCYIGLATIFRRFELSLFETTEENVTIVRDCFNGQTKPGNNKIKVKVQRDFTSA
ncbi:benzoate 4-monooxygenase cytochrome P450 [Microsporum canis CBS 113480]|uniref:Benzoate 4-monooxygenase cytochrome P450 n=1 Tax=Arthroderma otae (strain ATCC MYA-4605 / CBS 113480) TaxID=554155 RepID=C5FEC7_ARTOC|nr:benzoate 4-monooxygenase cytochrome P450 [Microsporum canis CBS 113480]EEQ28161.1 benzoate 4-monooxygenase cytochrome P450 [Microsporum canis CBS 113480]